MRPSTARSRSPLKSARTYMGGSTRRSQRSSKPRPRKGTLKEVPTVQPAATGDAADSAGAGPSVPTAPSDGARPHPERAVPASRASRAAAGPGNGAHRAATRASRASRTVVGLGNGGHREATRAPRSTAWQRVATKALCARGCVDVRSSRRARPRCTFSSGPPTARSLPQSTAI